MEITIFDIYWFLDIYYLRHCLTRSC